MNNTEDVTNEDTTLDPTSRDFIFDEVDDFHEAREDKILKEVVFRKPKKIEKVIVIIIIIK